MILAGIPAAGRKDAHSSPTPLAPSNTAYRPGDVMLISGPHQAGRRQPPARTQRGRIWPPVFDVSRMYTPQPAGPGSGKGQRAASCGFKRAYTCSSPAPSLRRPARIRAARSWAADAVGMSTVTEALTAAHCGMPLLALSVMTNMAAGVLDAPLSARKWTKPLR